METFAKIFERLLVFVYHCFDCIVIQGTCRCCPVPNTSCIFSAMCTVNIRSPHRSWRSELPSIEDGRGLRP
jgi:hypothetical protein